MSSVAVRARIDAAMPVRDFLRGVAKDFYDSILHQDLAGEQYEAIYAPAQPFCSTRFNFVPRQDEDDYNHPSERDHGE